MGKTFSTGLLTNGLWQDSSNNIGIGAAANASYKLQVTGTSNFTSTINGAGVSLSDTLNGTVANFTSSVTGNFFIASPVATAAQSGGLRLNSQVAINARNAANSADITLITSNSSDGVAIRNGALTIASTGAATFSSSVTAAGGNSPTLGFQLTTTTGSSTPRITSDNVNATVIRTGASGSPVVINNFANSSELVRFTDAGNVGIGTSSPSTFLHVLGSNTSGRGQLSIQSNNASNAAKATWYYDTFNSGEIGSTGSDFYVLATNDLPLYSRGGERVRVTTTPTQGMGCLLVNTSTRGDSYTIQTTSTNGGVAVKANGVGDAAYYASSSSVGYYFYADNTTNPKFYVQNNGDVKNTNNSYGAISDIKLKENIEDASPKLQDLLKVKIKNYNLISDESKTKQIGVIAQELEEIFPSMISEDKQMGSDETFKTVKYSVFVPMLIKAMQEQNQLIKDLESRIKQLENK